MICYVVDKSGPLNGSIEIGTSKNAILPIIAASMMTDEKITLDKMPNLSDVRAMLDILGMLGAIVKTDGGKCTLHSPKLGKSEPSYELVRRLRASFLVAGALLARRGQARLPMPGGCEIGLRPVDLHLKGFSAMGARVRLDRGTVDIRARVLKGADIYLDFPSVGATENLMIAATLAQGDTAIKNAAAEPEIADLAAFLNAMGAKVEGAGTDTIHITGVSALHGCSYTPIPDRIEAGTFMVAAALTGGDVHLENAVGQHVEPISAKLREMGADVEVGALGVRVRGGDTVKATTVKSMPYPGYPTDMQAPTMALMCRAKGTSMVTETVFENRFLHVGELRRLGANVKVEDRNAIVEGVAKLKGTQVAAQDLRGGASLLLAALWAEGQTRISGGEHIERGYERLDEKLCALGANVRREQGATPQ